MQDSNKHSGYVEHTTHHVPNNPAAWKVHAFHEAFGHPIAYIPQLPERRLTELRLNTLGEELCELGAAWDVRVVVKVEVLAKTNSTNARPTARDRDVYEVVVHDSENIQMTLAEEGKLQHPVVAAADAIVDMGYFLHGTALVSGTPFQAVFDAVHAANMNKLGRDGLPIKRADGKILKPEGWQPADVAEVLRKFGWKG